MIAKVRKKGIKANIVDQHHTGMDDQSMLHLLAVAGARKTTMHERSNVK